MRVQYAISLQRQQVVLTQQWAKANPAIHFSVMHPGWVDTPGKSYCKLTADLPPLQVTWTHHLPQHLPFESCVHIDASVPPDDGGQTAQCGARCRHCCVVGFVESCGQDTQRAVLPRWAQWNLDRLFIPGVPPCGFCCGHHLVILGSDRLFVLQIVGLCPLTCL